jgi:hypothetical protein
MRNKRKTEILAGLNLLAYVLVILVNAMANILPINGYNTGELSNDIPNLFVPAAFTFSIWIVIYFLLALFVFHQLRMSGRRKSGFIEDIGIWFAVSSAANAGWIFAWHYKMINLSLLLMIVILLSLIIIVLRLRSNRNHSYGFERIAVYHAFSVYLGWISVATIANVTAVLVVNGWNGFGMSDEFWTVIVIGVAIMLGLISILKAKDIPYALVIDWALIGIIIKRYQAGGLEYIWIILIATIGVLSISTLSLYKLIRR